MNANQLTVEVHVPTERLDSVKTVTERTARELAEVRRDLDRLHQRFDDHLKQFDATQTRRWAVTMALVAAVLSLASGLIVTLARK